MYSPSSSGPGTAWAEVGWAGLPERRVPGASCIQLGAWNKQGLSDRSHMVWGWAPDKNYSPILFKDITKKPITRFHFKHSIST